MFGAVSLLLFFLLLFLKSFLLVWDVETVVFLFFVILMSILIVLIRRAVLKSISLKIWFVYSLLNSLVLLNLNLLKKLFFIVKFLEFRILYFLSAFFCYYISESFKILYNRLNHLNFLRVRTFLFFFSYSLFSFEFRHLGRRLNPFLSFNNVNVYASYYIDIVQFVNFFVCVLYFLLFFIKNSLVMVFVLSFKKAGLLYRISCFLDD